MGQQPLRDLVAGVPSTWHLVVADEYSAKRSLKIETGLEKHCCVLLRQVLYTAVAVRTPVKSCESACQSQKKKKEEEEFYIHVPGPMWAYWMECSTSTSS